MCAKEQPASGHLGPGTEERLQRDGEPPFARSSLKAQLDPEETVQQRVKSRLGQQVLSGGRCLGVPISAIQHCLGWAM